jgi:zinc finger MYND domain-containing protein 10
MLYHRTAAESCDDGLVELIDYCYRKFVGLTQAVDAMGEDAPDYMAPEDPKQMGLNTPEQMLDHQYKEIDFTVTMTCLSLIRFITDHMEALPASIVH